MMISPWGSYVLGDTQYGGSGAVTSGPAATQGGSVPSGSGGGGGGADYSSFYSPESVRTYGDVTANILAALTGRPVVPPPGSAPGATSPTPSISGIIPLLVIGGVVIGLVALVSTLRRRKES